MSGAGEAVRRMRSLLRGKSAAIMGIINVTPDSFSDGGRFSSPRGAVEHALDLIEQGADIIDIGGESTRPGAQPVSLQEEIDRVIPVIQALRACSDHPISVDTQKPMLMKAAVKAGASMINDVNALLADGAIEAAAEASVPVCLMHRQGTSSTMQNAPEYRHVSNEVLDYLLAREAACVAAGIAADDIVLDPGIGFGKTLEHNLQLLSALPVFRQASNSQWLIGVSRKSMIDHLLHRDVADRLSASLGLAVQAALNGARILRVHDVRATYDALRSVEAVLAQSSQTDTNN